MKTPVAAGVRLYARYEKYAAIVFFLGGVGYDFLTLNRIDRLADNLILLGYILALGVLVALTGRLQLGKLTHPRVVKYGHLLPLGSQFLLGSLFSAYTVFYFASVSMTRTAVFFILLVLLLVANERLKERLSNLPLLMSMFFFVSFSFSIFFIPVLVGAINRWTFALGTLLSVLLVAGVLWAIYGRELSWVQPQLQRIVAWAGGLCGLLVLFYMLNWIPPVPLALKSGGIYHQVRKEGAVYHLTFVKPPRYKFWQKSEDPFHLRPGERIYCFASIFAPTELKTRIYHRWQRYDEKKGEWVDAGRIGYDVSGGRAGGYRGFTYKQAVSPGEWQVDVETEEGLLLGSIPFDVVDAAGQELPFATIQNK